MRKSCLNQIRPFPGGKLIAPISFSASGGPLTEEMTRADRNRVVHLELHTGDLSRACAFYAEVCGWRPEMIETAHGSYLALELGDAIGGGVVECPTQRSLWLPYVQVAEIGAATERARVLGASVLLGPREGPSGWRSVVAAPSGGEIAFWQPKR
jgi:predicted enzyme related to lactoylglutathione lyase